jgi:hypothetical protein
MDSDENREIGGGPGRGLNPLVLVPGIVGGPIAFGITRFAGMVLVSGPCSQSTGGTMVAGLTPSQQIFTAITIVCAIIAAISGLWSWHIWRNTPRREQDQPGESMRAVPFWALGGVFLSAVFFCVIVLDGGLALGLSSGCAS